MSNIHHSLFIFMVWFQPPKTLSLDRAPTFHIFLGINTSKKGEKLAYYHLYNEEGSFHLDVFPQLFNGPFLFFFV